jgi:hypothetical protein
MHLLGFPLQLKMQIFLSHFYMMLMMQIILNNKPGLLQLYPPYKNLDPEIPR